MLAGVEIVIVAGMHRSGTSSLAGALVKMGATPPSTIMPATHENERGFWESVAMMAINDEILGAVGSGWKDWRPIPPFWADDAFVDRFRERAVATVTAEFGASAFWVLKDPRLCRILPFWLRIFDELGASTRILLPVRNPLEVAYSMRKRNGFNVGFGLLAWLAHVLDAESDSRGRSRAIVDWRAFLFDWRLSIQRAADHLGFAWPAQSDQAIMSMDDFLSEDLRHNVVDDADFAMHPDVTDWVRQVHAALLRLAVQPQDAQALQTLDDIRADFRQAATLFGRVVFGFERQHADLEASNRLLVERSRIAEERSLAFENEARNVGSLRDRLAQEVDLHAQRARQAEEMTGAVRREVEQLAGERERLRHALTRTEVDRDHFGGEAHRHGERAKAAEQDLAGLRDAQARLEAQVADTEARGQAIEARYRDAAAEAQAEREHRRATDAECSRLLQALHDAEGRAALLQREAETIAGERDAVGAAHVALAAAGDDLAAQRDAAAAERDAVTAERDRAIADREAMTVDLRRHAEQADSARRDLQRLVEERDQAASRGVLGRLRATRHPT